MNLREMVPIVVLLGACHGSSATPMMGPSAGGASGRDVVHEGGATAVASLPLVLVTDVNLPGNPVRFDYQDLDVAKGHLVIAHMNDASVVIVKVSDGSLVKVLPHIPTARGVVVA